MLMIMLILYHFAHMLWLALGVSEEMQEQNLSCACPTFVGHMVLTSMTISMFFCLFVMFMTSTFQSLSVFFQKALAQLKLSWLKSARQHAQKS